MTWARNIAGVLAVGTLGCWVMTAVFWPFHIYAGKNVIVANRQGIACLLPDPFTILPLEFEIARYGGDWLELPTIERVGDTVALDLPHWLTNLVAWSLFIILWRKCLKQPKGHCQKCGYDMTGNTTGRCPECNTDSLTAKP